MTSTDVTQPSTRAAGRDPMLSVDDIHVFYGNIAAVKGISLTVYPGEIVTLIGGNGAGKSTTMRTISGLFKPKRGEVQFEGKRVSGLKGHEVAQRGIAQSPEGRRIFPRMTVTENLELGAFLRNDKAEIAADMDRVFELFPRLKERLTQKSGTLSGGEQQMLAMGRALMARPRLLLLDEPSMGLAPVLVEQVFDTITKVNEQGTTVLLVEQNALVALNIANHGYVLETGQHHPRRPGQRAGPQRRGPQGLPRRGLSMQRDLAPGLTTERLISERLHDPNPIDADATATAIPTRDARRCSSVSLSVIERGCGQRSAPSPTFSSGMSAGRIGGGTVAAAARCPSVGCGPNVTTVASAPLTGGASGDHERRA